MKLKSRILSNSLYLFFSLLWGCGVLSFSGNALSSDVKTFSIQTFYTEISDGPTDMRTKLTEALAEKILRTTDLTREEKDGNIQYEGVIKSFAYRSTFSTKSEDGSSKEVQRLTITIEVSYLHPSDEASSFKKKQFSASADMISTENQLEKEPQLIEEIFRQLVDDICRKSIDNW